MNKTIATIGLGAVAFTISSIEASAMENGIINVSTLNIRSGPSTGYNRIDKAYKGSFVEILEKSNGWYKVKLANGTVGWGSGQYININKQEPPVSQVPTQGNKGKVIANPRLNIRSGPNASYPVLAKANYGEVVELLEKSSGWYKVKLSNGMTGWGSGDYIVSVTSTPGDNDSGSNDNTIKPPSISDSSQPANRASVVNLAYKLIGTPYGWGGNGPDNFDCSGFTRYVYSKAECKNIPRVSRDQANYGVEVSRENFVQGDLVYFDTNGDGVINHVGIYVGNNEFIHASGTPTNPEAVKKENLGTSYWNKVLVGARRF